MVTMRKRPGRAMAVRRPAAENHRMSVLPKVLLMWVSASVPVSLLLGAWLGMASQARPETNT